MAIEIKPKSGRVPEAPSANDSEPLQATLAAPARQYPGWRSLLPIMVALVALAFGLRVFQLGTQSLWYDEGFSVYLSAQSLAAITERTANDIQPPLYYYMLHFWMLLAGRSEFAVRYLSLIWGVLGVPLVMQVARRLFRGPVIAGVAAFLTAILPVLVYYGQETRMYTALIALCTFTAWCQLKLFAHYNGKALAARSFTVRWIGTGISIGLGSGTLLWLGYVLANIAAMYTHYYAFFFIAASALAWLGWLLVRKPGWGVFARCVLAGWAIAVAYLPWSQFALTRYNSDTSYWEGTLDFGTVLRQTAMLFSGAGVPEVPGDHALAFMPVWGLLLLAGIIALLWEGRQKQQRASWQALLYLLLWLVVPIVLLWMISYARPKFHPRYLLLIAPAYILLLARGLAALYGLGRSLPARRSGIILLATGLLVAGLLAADGLHSLYFDPAFGRDDWRSVAGYIKTHEEPNDEIVLLAGHTFPVLTYYYDRDNWHKIPPDDYTLSTTSIVGYNIANQLNEIARTKQQPWQIWVVLWQDRVVDPNSVLARMLSEQAERLPVGQNFQGLHLLRYQIKPGTIFKAEPDIQHPLPADFGGKLMFKGYDGPLQVQSGGTIPMTFYWIAKSTLDKDYLYTLRVVDAQHHEWGRIDQSPATNSTLRWRPGELVPGTGELQIAPGTPPGEYNLELGVYSQINGKPGASLDVLQNGSAAGQQATIGKLTVLPAANPPAEVDLKMAEQVHAQLAPSGPELLGYTLNTPEVAAGNPLGLSLFWRAQVTPAQDYTLQLTLGPASATFNLASAGYPTSRWQPGEILRSQYDLPVPANATSGTYPLAATLLDASGKPVGNQLQIAQVKITGREHTTIRPNPQIASGALLSTTIELTGFDLSTTKIKAGQDLTLTLYWHALAPVPASYKVFTQLIAPGAANPVKAQSDKIPGDYSLPTTSWITGEYIADRYLLHIKEDTPPGKYLLITGMYPDPNGPRLPVYDAAHNPAGDYVQLSEIEVAGK